MSRYTLLQKRPIYQAVAATLLGLLTNSSYAVTVGQASVQSEQHEPLVATIAVNNIDAQHFKASLASGAIYQQMGLEQTAISVQFVPTSDTAGKILLTSNQPISAPFTDIVLDLNNNGEQHIEPQTLLMPLPKTGNIATEPDPQTIVATGSMPNLPVTSNDIGDTDYTDDSVSADYTDDSVSIAQQLGYNMPNTQASNSRQTINNLTPEGTNVQHEILTNQTNLTSDYDSETSQQSEDFEGEIQDASTAVYVVQSGDNLWYIASEIAKANNSNINEVMQSLHRQNPNAFRNNNINKLKANVSLRIVNYKVVPSQKAISDAISAKIGRHTNEKITNKPHKSNESHKSGAINAKNGKPKHSKHTTASRIAPKPLPKPQVTLVTPSKTGSVVGGGREQNSTNTQSVGGGDLVANLKNTRATTAQTAKKVNGLNQELSSATQKLQLQNQKLAELEARLKALKDN